MFDQLQRAHLTDASNIAEPKVVRDVARETGLRPKYFAKVFDDPVTVQAVERDRQRARSLQVQSVPTLIVREIGARLVNGPYEDLAAQIHAAKRLAA